MPHMFRCIAYPRKSEVQLEARSLVSAKFLCCGDDISVCGRFDIGNDEAGATFRGNVELLIGAKLTYTQHDHQYLRYLSQRSVFNTRTYSLQYIDSPELVFDSWFLRLHRTAGLSSTVMSSAESCGQHDVD